MSDNDYWSLCELVAPGWSLREGYACGPSAEGPFWLTAPDYGSVVWRTWCYFFGCFELQDGETYVWPMKPSDWRDKIAEARGLWEKSRVASKELLFPGLRRSDRAMSTNETSEISDAQFVGMREETPVGTAEIIKEGTTYVVMFYPKDGGRPEDLHSGPRAWGAYLYLCGFSTGVHFRDKSND